jgi:hypothetical protein
MQQLDSLRGHKCITGRNQDHDYLAAAEQQQQQHLLLRHRQSAAYCQLQSHPPPTDTADAAA